MQISMPHDARRAPMRVEKCSTSVDDEKKSLIAIQNGKIRKTRVRAAVCRTRARLQHFDAMKRARVLLDVVDERDGGGS